MGSVSMKELREEAKRALGPTAVVMAPYSLSYAAAAIVPWQEKQKRLHIEFALPKLDQSKQALMQALKALLDWSGKKAMR